mmetsp:Transcript_24577/g.37865  ORF Transcript_24577/g.37865 Transcript_24577/m.37865 type:complete len:204 (+) Transcript_24577:456-1067(+)
MKIDAPIELTTMPLQVRILHLKFPWRRLLAIFVFLVLRQTFFVVPVVWLDVVPSMRNHQHLFAAVFVVASHPQKHQIDFATWPFLSNPRHHDVVVDHLHHLVDYYCYFVNFHHLLDCCLRHVDFLHLLHDDCCCCCCFHRHDCHCAAGSVVDVAALRVLRLRHHDGDAPLPRIPTHHHHHLHEYLTTIHEFHHHRKNRYHPNA